MLKKINTGALENKKIHKKTQKFPNVSEILFYTSTKELNLTPEQFSNYHNNSPNLLGKRTVRFFNSYIIHR